MNVKTLLIIGMSASAMMPAVAQIDHWKTLKFGTLQCDFPASYAPINFPGASGVFYDGGSVYLTVTAQPDTSSMKGNDDRDYTRDFMNVVLNVSRKLDGRVREYRDTVIANMPGYISKMEITFKDGRKSTYELVQLLQQDSMRGFSAQYYQDDPKALQASQRFFSSIGVAKSSTPALKPGRLGIWIGGAVVLALAVWTARKRLIVKKK